MKLNLDSIKDRKSWEKLSISLPHYNIEKTVKQTSENPKWLHFGAGNIFRAFIARAQDDLLDRGLVDTGIIAVESFDFYVISEVYKKCDNLSLLVSMKTDGTSDKRVISSITHGLTTNNSSLKHWFCNPELQIVSFTVTEKGYNLKSPNGGFLDIIKQDITNGPENTKHLMSIITSLLFKRFQTNAAPITLVSMDNCSHNGDKLKESILTIASEWLKNGFVNEDFIQYLNDEEKITFPLSMIDKITPRPSETVKRDLVELGLKDMEIIITDKGTYMAPFVNAEVSEYLVIEDKFTNGRPPLEKAGIIFTTRDTVNNVEIMKVTTCLNPLHTALAVTGCLLGYNSISDEMKDPLLLKLIETIGYQEGLKTVVDPGIIDPKDFIDEVVQERLPNPSIPDTPQRIASDTSQKVGIRFGYTIKSYMESSSLDENSLVGIPLAIASWCRYLHGLDDNGLTFKPSPDPLLETLQDTLKKEGVQKIIGNIDIFGVDLYKSSLGKNIESYYYEMLDGPGTVRETLKKYLVLNE